MQGLRLSEKHLLVGSVALSSLVGLAILPVLTRVYSHEAFASVTLVLLANGLFGICDVLRPSIVSLWACEPSGPVSKVFLPVAALFGALYSVLVFLLVSVFAEDYFNIVESLLIALATFSFIFYSTFWGVLDLNGRVGTGAFVRASGNSLVYLGLALAPFMASQPSPAAVLFSVQLIMLVTFTWLSRRFLASGIVDTVLWRRRLLVRGLRTAQQNAAKIVIDSADRLLLARLAPASIVAVYNASYELAAKLNLPSQLVSAFLYPKLCKRDVSELEFLRYGLWLSLGLIGLSYPLIAVGDLILGAYLGEAFAAGGPLLSGLVAVSGIYSLAFFSQAALRARDKYSVLGRHFAITAIIGLALAVPLYKLWGVVGLVVAAAILKAPGVLGYLFLARSMGRRREAVMVCMLVMLTGFSILLGSRMLGNAI